MAALKLSTAHCPEVPRSRENRPYRLHGPTEHDTARTLVTSHCGRICNPPETFVSGGFMPALNQICRSCLRNKAFAQQVQTALHL